MTQRRYADPYDFKQALEVHLKRHATASNLDIARVRQRFVFERFLARVTVHFGDRVIVKGGVALELRIAGARVTRDVDLRLSGDPLQLLSELRSAGQRPLDGDFLLFSVDPDPNHPTIETEGAAYEGQRFRVKATLAGKIFAARFGVDVAFGDRMAQPPELIDGGDFLSFIGIPPIKVSVYAREVHVAEKLHALTLPRLRENTRVKDLPDLAVLATTGPFESHAVAEAIRLTFDQRATHPPPVVIPQPPELWRIPYARLATENRLRWTSLDEITEAVRAFLDPVLRAEQGIWDPISWTWR